jgi:voltage-gated potassium channel Kch
MLASLLIGTIAIIATVLIHTFGLIAVTRGMAFATRRFKMHGHRSKVVAMVTTVLGLFLVLSVEIWVWALVYVGVGAFPDFEHALYFSTVSFSTVGFGDIVPVVEWRMLGALEAINGFLMIGWSTAYLIAASTRIGPFRPGEHF